MCVYLYVWFVCVCIYKYVYSQWSCVVYHTLGNEFLSLNNEFVHAFLVHDKIVYTRTDPQHMDGGDALYTNPTRPSSSADDLRNEVMHA